MLNQHDLFFFLTVLGQGAPGKRLVEACVGAAKEPDVDLPTLLVRQGILDAQQVAHCLQALHELLERYDWRPDAVLEELTRLAGAERLGECWEAVTIVAQRGPADPERYHDSRLHAEGGLGRVWQARDQRMGRVVALKNLRPEHAGRPPVLSRFIQEAQITSQLEHPNIIPIYDLQEGAAPFYTMRLLCGRTLQDALERFHADMPGRWSALEFHKLLLTFAQVCEAIAHAHSRGIIHRDLKPANVALGDYNAVMVIDWGLARRLGDPEIAGDDTPATGHLDRTRAGDVLGTPAFMAPEQAAGDQERIGPATDVYGLGAMLFAILTGQPPHAAQEGETMPAFFQRIAATATPRARDRRPDIPPPLDAICARAMAHMPADRYAGAADIAADVHRWLAGQAVTAYRESWHLRLGRWLKQHPAWTQAAASIALLLVVTASIVITHSWAAARTLAQVGQTNLEQEARSLDDIYQARLDDFAARARFFTQLPLLSAMLHDPQAEQRQRFEDMLNAAIRLRPEYLEVGVFRASPWTQVIQLARDQPGDAKLRVSANQPVESPAMLDFLARCARLPADKMHIAIVPPRQVGVSATLWVGLPVHDGANGQIGVIFLVADLQRLLQTPEATGLAGGYVHIADATGHFLTKPIADETRAAVGSVMDHNPALADYFATRPLAEAAIVPSDDARLTACRRLNLASSPTPEQLVLLIERPLDAQAEAAARSRRLVMGLTALVIVAALLLTYGLVRLLARGLSANSI